MTSSLLQYMYFNSFNYFSEIVVNILLKGEGVKELLWTAVSYK